MRTFPSLLILSLLAFGSLLITVLTVNADTPAPGGPFNTAFRVQNLGTDTARCIFYLYRSDGTIAYTSGEATIAPGDSLYVYTPALTGLADGIYSAVVSASQPVAAVVNFSDPDSGASHSGITSNEIAPTWYAPGIYDNFYNYYSNIIVQNATASPVDITAYIYAPGSSTPVATQTASNVPAYASVSFEQEGMPELSNNIAYSAKITATGNIAAIVNIYGRGPYDGQLYSYNPFTSGSTKAYAPVIMNAYYGYNTSLTVQNIGTASTPVTVTYGTGQQWTGIIAANSAQQLYTPVSGVPAGSLTGAVVESGGEPIVVLVNESTDKNRAASYSGFAAGSTTVRAPIVMRRYYRYNTSITCQNVGTAAAKMRIQYAGIAGTTESPTSIPPGGTYMFYQPIDTLLSDNWIGSATISCDEPIVCVVNEDKNEPPERDQVMDMLYAYNGIGQ